MKKNFFTYLPVENGKQNWFDLGHSNSGSCNMGHLIPVLVEPTLPGDYFKCNISYLLRMAQMVAPPMTRIGVSFFPFYCPNRILMDSKQWDKFLADVDGNSGVGLPSLSFSPIFSSLKSNLLELLSYEFIEDISYSFDNSALKTALNDAGIEGVSIIGEDIDVISIGQGDGLLGESFVFDGVSLTVGEHVFNFIKNSIPNRFPFVGTLMDFLGFPVRSDLFDICQFFNYNLSSDRSIAIVSVIDVLTPQRAFQVLPMIAYLRIWNEYFRQEFIQEEIPEGLVEDFNSWKDALSSDISLLWRLKRRDWEHDYFTSCLPAPQLGESSSIEIGEDGKFTIPELREANVIQRIREKLLHGGTRIWEIIANFFSERVNDSRIQIPEFIKPSSGGFSWLRISDIYQTAPGTSDSFPSLDPSANIAAPRGASVNADKNGVSFSYSCPEHGYLMVLMNIQPEPVYCQGIPRHYLSLDTLDYGWPDFANITEQPVYQYEVYADSDNVRKGVSGDYSVFGWQSQYAWYKFHNSELHGELRDDLDFFHFARIFESSPNLNDEFLQCNPSDRPFPITYEYDKLTYHLAIDLRVNRRLPYFGIPSLR